MKRTETSDLSESEKKQFFKGWLHVPEIDFMFFMLRYRVLFSPFHAHT